MISLLYIAIPYINQTRDHGMLGATVLNCGTIIKKTDLMCLTYCISVADYLVEFRGIFKHRAQTCNFDSLTLTNFLMTNQSVHYVISHCVKVCYKLTG